jgi:hypothetical protein
MENDLPALEAADFIDAALEARADAAYFGDRDYPVAAEWAGGANPYARANPDAPWVSRLLPVRSTAASVPGDLVYLGHESVSHDFPLAEPSRKVQARLLVRVERAERVA